jgi:NAD(P)-dependent dehydrogenase (short-subunit alcohol dehydrogenase family)
VIGLVKTASSELLADGIRVNAVAPTGMVTPLTADVSIGDAENLDRARELMSKGRPLGRAGEADDVANAFLFLASDEGGYISGHTLVIDAGDTTGGSAASFASRETTVFREGGGRGVGS